MAGLLRRSALAVAIALGTTALLLGCKGNAGKATTDAGADASDAGLDVSLPETVIVVLEAGVSPDGVGTLPPSNAATVVHALPRPCTDRALGLVTFAEERDGKVTITSSKGVAHATCVHLDEHKLLCDWFDGEGKPTVTRKGVTFGPKTKIGGSYDAKHSFGCPAQDDTPPKPVPPKPGSAGKKPRR